MNLKRPALYLLVPLITFSIGLTTILLLVYCPASIETTDQPIGTVASSIQDKPVDNSVQNLSSDTIKLEEYVIYSTIIDEMYSFEKIKLAVIQDQTTPFPVDQKEPNTMDYVRERLPELKPEALANYIANNKAFSHLTNIFSARIRCVVVSDKDLKPVFKKAKHDRFWRPFYKRYPNSSGIIFFSKVGFNAEMNQAFLYAGRQCGGLCGAGQYILLVKEESVWKIKQKLNLWVS
jgi:hypothetical protein